MRIGIYSGSFDPVHLGHVRFALEAARSCHLDKVYFLVEPRPRHKQGVKAFEHRVAMVRIALGSYDNLGTLLVDQRRFSVLETWPVLEGRFHSDDLYMLMGDDVFARLSHWPMVETLITSVRFIVGVRHGQHAQLRHHLSTIRAVRGLSLHYDTFTPTGAAYSSTAIRRALRQGSQPVGLDPAVAEYIADTKLYAPASSDAID